MSRPQEVIQHYRRVIRLARQTGNRFEEARACSNLGYLYIDGGRWWRSEVLSKHALAIFEELDSDHGRAHTHNHLGLLYTRRQSWEDAEQNLKAACRIWETNRDVHSVLFAYMNLGVLYVEIGKPKSALEYLQNAYQVAQDTGDKAHIPRIWNTMAIAYRISLNWKDAEAYAKEAERLFREYSDQHSRAHVLHNLGLIFDGVGNTTLALQYFAASLDLHRSLNNQADIEDLTEEINKRSSYAKE